MPGAPNLICDCGHLLVYARHSLYDKGWGYEFDNFKTQMLGNIPCDRNCPKKFIHLRCSYCSKVYHKGNQVTALEINQKGKQIFKDYIL